MKQLLDVQESCVIAGLNDRAFVGPLHSEHVTELQPPSKYSSNETTEAQEAEKAASQQGTDVNLLEIQAVSVIVNNEHIWGAVARYDKSLALYELNYNNNEPASSLKPITVHKTAKRVSCLTFAKVGSMTVVIAGDLAGDAVAFSLRMNNKTDDDDQAESNSNRRLLLGHTASILTAVKVVTDSGVSRILTADRDEKIRVSSFPDCHIIQGFLLGHEAYVTSLDVASKDNCTRCISCGGDSMMRLWDYGTCQELAMASLSSDDKKRMPTKIAMNPAGDIVVVIYDESRHMDIFQLHLQNAEGLESSLELSKTVELPSQPLAASMCHEPLVLLLTRDPVEILAYAITHEGSSVDIEKSELSFCQAIKKLAGKESIVLPTSIIERDQWGNVKMEKLSETRGPAQLQPWNDASRKEVARERNKRLKQRQKNRRFEKKEGRKVDDANEEEP